MMQISNSQTFGELVKAERKRQKVTQAELAALAGVGIRFVRELENGKETCQLGLAISVAVTLGISITAHSRES